MSILSKINDSLDEATKVSLRKLAAQFANVAPATIPTPELAAVPNVPVTNEVKLPDGTSLKYEGETLGVESKVMLVTPDGELPVPDGELTLEDGTMLTIVGSVVTEMEAPTAVVVEDQPSELSKLTERLAAIESKLTAMEVPKPSTELVALKSQVKDLTNILSKIVEVPTAEPIEVPVSSFQRKVDEKFSRITKFSNNK